ncbi:hypothetical protein EMIHUDRAFT_116661 [Emiliania huxleyi CCMP1516]|uniref:GPI inositol-deacylase n=2 Tax=Emiliania huxleyi TaxID=2903 RepID=A0A0D3JGD1_EMIH1|nr:hypothetical protein EMIHUDRAFT_116661 [Emiliania huxleyi CCMP1516]EOD22566.1 hypothetical protein EMIHUDRAFT_116661 [Emiliania huxleyi CCMP1516]|eukprot:XP_005774995.1 hypothetical protein EMIHUDRAFT_116661 [Emiliania huxleyi CCMP1516]
MRLAAAGVACIVAPLTLLLLAPLTLLLLPILVPLGLLLTAVGVARAGIVVSMDGSRQRARSPRSPADRSGPQAEAASRSEEACATPSSRRKRRASWGSSSREGLPLDRRASSAQDRPYLPISPHISPYLPISPHNSSAQDRPPELSPNLPTAIALSAASVPVPVELQSWVGANPNLKPYCTGRIGRARCAASPTSSSPANLTKRVVPALHGDVARVVLLGHSKGAVDAAAALSLFPELRGRVAALVSVQGPHGGSAIAHDLANTQVKYLSGGELQRVALVLALGAPRARLWLAATSLALTASRSPAVAAPPLPPPLPPPPSPPPALAAGTDPGLARAGAGEPVETGAAAAADADAGDASAKR